MAMFSEDHRAKVTDALVSGELARTASRLFRECDTNQSGALELSFGEIRIFIVEVFDLLDLERPIEGLIYDIYKRFDAGSKGALNFEESLQLVVFLCNVVLGIQTPPTGMLDASDTGRTQTAGKLGTHMEAAAQPYLDRKRGEQMEQQMEQMEAVGTWDTILDRSQTEKPRSFASSPSGVAPRSAATTTPTQPQMTPSSESARRASSPEVRTLRPMSLAQKMFREDGSIPNGLGSRDGVMSPAPLTSPLPPAKLANQRASSMREGQPISMLDGSARMSLGMSAPGSLRSVATAPLVDQSLAWKPASFAAAPTGSFTAAPPNDVSGYSFVAAPSAISASSLRASSRERVLRNPVAQVITGAAIFPSSSPRSLSRAKELTKIPSNSPRATSPRSLSRGRPSSMARRTDSRDFVRGSNSGSLLGGTATATTCTAIGARTPRFESRAVGSSMGLQSPRSLPVVTPAYAKAATGCSVTLHASPSGSPPVPSGTVVTTVRRAASIERESSAMAQAMRGGFRASSPGRAAAGQLAAARLQSVQRPWSVEHCLALDTYPRGPFAGKVKILPRKAAPDIHIAADMLNSGAIECLEDFAVVFSESTRSHVLMYKFGREQDALEGLAMSR